MRKSLYTYAMLLALPVVALMTSCEPRSLGPEDVIVKETELDKILAEENPDFGYKIYDLNEFLDTFMTEEGSYHSDTTPYRSRSHDAIHDLYMYSVDTLPKQGKGIYIRGRISTDDYAGNFYKAMVIQQIVNNEQQNLRISVDLGSSHGLYQMGQEILIRCNGLAVGRYANQPQLCVPSYNNNTYAMNAGEKVGWAPGRIESSIFRKVTRMIGVADPTKLKYDVLTLSDLYTQIQKKPSADATGMDAVRKADGRLVVIKGVHFTGQFDDNGTLAKCDTLHPDSSSNANVFAPTTKNIGYPQSRLLSDGTNSIMCSNSEYSKFAYFYLPGANRHGVDDCEYWEGTVTGILGWYLDKASDLAEGKLDGYEWSVTPRGIPGIGVSDIFMQKEVQPDEYEEWIPKEFDPNDYQ